MSSRITSAVTEMRAFHIQAAKMRAAETKVTAMLTFQSDPSLS